jgi:hypothetical protein
LSYVKHLNHKFLLNRMQKFCSCLTENTLYINYNYKLLTLFREIFAIILRISVVG